MRSFVADLEHELAAGGEAEAGREPEVGGEQPLVDQAREGIWISGKPRGTSTRWYPRSDVRHPEHGERGGDP